MHRGLQGSYAKLTQSNSIESMESPRQADELYEFVCLRAISDRQQVMPDDHSEVVPLLPIPNRTVKRFSADDSADTRVKVGHRQAITALNAPSIDGAFLSEPLTGFACKDPDKNFLQKF